MLLGHHIFSDILATRRIFNMKNISLKLSNTTKRIKNAFEIYPKRSFRDITLSRYTSPIKLRLTTIPIKIENQPKLK
jgi:hypothetical protein